MSRQAETRHPIHDLLKRRWSPRAFDPNRPVEHEKLRSIFEAARWASSSFNAQPWHFLVATKEQPDEFQKMLNCLVEKNQQWAKNAPVLIIPVATLKFAHNDKANRHAFHDVGLAVGALVVQATALDLYLHQMAGFSPEKAREAYQIPEQFEPVSAIALGYLGDPNSLPEDLRQREHAPSPRKHIDEFVYAGRWGHTADWVKG
jgi:nitroreductase